MKVTYVGGPLCGRSEKWREADLVEFLTYSVEGREFHYQHVFKPITEGTLRVQHRYLFCGHKPKLPSWVRKEIAKRKKMEGGDGE
jgi:hypothetical protein